ncbi:MAG: MG2 domain-containing protein [Bacteroides sp.]|nr:MG2 domain-containing protein [Bacteroides sp.]
MKKLICNQWIAWIAILFLSVTLHACKQKQEDITPSSRFASYVTAYTGGIISQSSPIRIELAAGLPMVEPYSELKDHPFSFSPSLKGKAWWVDNKTIEFIPDEGALRPGKFYQGTFKLGDLIQVDKELEKFTFSFRVMERNFAVEVDMPYIQAADPERVSISGIIQLSDKAEPATIEKMLSLKTAGGQTPSLTIEPSNTPDRYRFTIHGITRTREGWVLEIEANGKPFGTDHIVRKRVTIPATEDFTFLSAQRISSPEQGLRLSFSDPLSTQQDLRGLISLQGVREYTQQVDGNRVDIYFDPLQVNSYTLEIDRGVRNYKEERLEEERSLSFSKETHKPEVKISTSGTILPDSKNLLVPFRAVSLKAVDLTVVRIFENNVPMFLQDNSLSSSRELRRSGRMIYRKMLRLDQDPTYDLTQWNDFSIDLSELIRQEPGAIYRIMLSFKQDYSLYLCAGKVPETSLSDQSAGLTRILPEEEADYDESVWDQPSGYYYMENEGYNWCEYDWQQRDNPCHPSYYMVTSRKASCNVLATNLGMIVKRNQAGKLWIAVTDLLTAQPLGQVDITLYNFQLQPIGETKTNSEGLAEIELKGVPFVAVASREEQKTYLKLVDGEELSMSRFDTGGKSIEKGLKGFIYGERGVWRPGDTLHVTFILEDREKRIPDTHPVSLELYTPQGQFYTRQIASKGVNGFYTFNIETHDNDPTGV